MKVRHYREIQPIDVEKIERTAEGLTMRRVLSEIEGAVNFVMDVFEIKLGGHSSYHSHPWEHEVFVIRGAGTLVGAEEDLPFKEGDVIFIPPDEPHQFKNTGAEPVEFVCLIPKAALTSYYLERISTMAPPKRGRG